ncbi:MAG: HEAT repeat domain-containing protein [Armatimonadetes bacterium]|nr:HEAT repeat domain-containing protein [Armatimonadota bacterium]
MQRTHCRWFGGLVVVAAAALLAPVAAQDGLHQKIEDEFARIRPYGLYGNERAAMNLIAMAPTLHTARPEFVAALADKHMVVRWTAARVLGLIGPKAKDAVPALAAALPTSEWYAQVEIAWALAQMGPAARDAVPALLATLSKTRNVWVQRAVVAALGEIGPEAREALPALRAASQDPNGFVRVAAAAALYQVGRDGSGLPLLIEALKDYTIVGPRVAADTLAKLGEGAKPAVPALVDTLKDPAPCARVAAARALWLIDRNTQGVPALLAAQQIKDEPEVQKTAAETLKLIGAATGKAFPGPPAETVAPPPLVFKAEEWSGPQEAIVKDRWVEGKWNLWTKDAPNWSRGTILAAPAVAKDRATPEEGAPVLHTRITGVPPGSYQVTVQHERTIAVSVDEGKTWIRHDSSKPIGYFTIKADGTLDLWVDDRYASSGAPGPAYYNTITLTPGEPPPPKPAPPTGPVQGWAKQRVTEKLERGLVAMRTEAGVNLSWRLLADDPANIAFDVYRAVGSGAGQKISASPVSKTTDYLDQGAPAEANLRYWVTLAGKPKDRVACTPVTPAATPTPYLPIKLQGDYRTHNVGVGDLDGDGRMDYVIKQPDTQIWGFLYTWYYSPDTYKLEAYNADGKFLWRQSMGWGVEMGVWFAPFYVRDLDGDGKAEVIQRGMDADPRDAQGWCEQGAEYVVVRDGLTGKVRARAEWPGREGFGTSARAGDVAARHQITVAYLDGKTPCIVVERGTYGLQKVMAYQLKGNKLERVWQWDNQGLPRIWVGQGAHTLHAADVDADGRDEVILGCSVLDDNGVPLWTTGQGHPDVCCVGDFTADSPGLEVYYCLETPQKTQGVCMVDGKTGKVLWGRKEETIHVGFGVTSDIDPAQPGCEAWAKEDPKTGAFGGGPPPTWLFSAKGELLAEGKEVPGTGMLAYWDADIQRELISGAQARDYRGGAHPPQFAGSVVAVADVIGDWREEVITSLPGEIRIYSSTIPARDRRVCLLQDPTYRGAVADITSGYYSQPMLGYLPVCGTSSVMISAPGDGLVAEAANSCEALVTASPRAPLAGMLQLTVGPGATVQPASHAVALGPGQTATFPFALRLTKPLSPLAGRVTIPLTARLTPVGQDPVEGRASLTVKDVPMSGPSVIGAGDFVSQSGGEARLRTDKPGSCGRAMSHWNYKGHRIEWEIPVAQAGKYHLVFRYANSWGWIAERSLLVDGRAHPGATVVRFPPVGTVLDEWATLPVRCADGKLATWELAPGTHRLAMENTNDCWLNLDQIAFIPAV